MVTSETTGNGPTKPPAIVIRDKSTKAEVHRVKVPNPTESKVSRVMRGILINLDAERFELDVSEFAGLFGD
jgi:hypothetical protein